MPDHELIDPTVCVCVCVQGSNKHLRAMTIFALPMMLPSMALQSQRPSSEREVQPRIGIEAVYNRVSRLLSADVSSDLPRMFEPEPPVERVFTPRPSMS